VSDVLALVPVGHGPNDQSDEIAATTSRHGELEALIPHLVHKTSIKGSTRNSSKWKRGLRRQVKLERDVAVSQVRRGTLPECPRRRQAWWK
jgi:hypothetical protein